MLRAFKGLRINQVWHRRKPSVNEKWTGGVVRSFGDYWGEPALQVRSFDIANSEMGGTTTVIFAKNFHFHYHAPVGPRKPNLVAGVTILKRINGPMINERVKVIAVSDDECLIIPWNTRKDEPMEGRRQSMVSIGYSFWTKFQILKPKKKKAV